MPYGLSAGQEFTAAPADNPDYGDIQWDSMAGRDTSPAMVGGPDWGLNTYSPDDGFSRISTGPDPATGGPIPGQAKSKVTDWKMALNPHGPTLFIMLFALAAVGLIHARVNLGAGPAHVDGGVG